jgi:hypothetical protein
MWWPALPLCVESTLVNSVMSHLWSPDALSVQPLAFMWEWNMCQRK